MKTKELTQKCNLRRINIKFTCEERKKLTKSALRFVLNSNAPLTTVRKKVARREDFGEGIFSVLSTRRIMRQKLIHQVKEPNMVLEN